jgi:hypothetical protein
VPPLAASGAHDFTAGVVAAQWWSGARRLGPHMPFSCEAKLDAAQIRQDAIIFDGWIDDAWNKFVPPGTAFARCHDGNGPCLLLLNGAGYLSSKPKLKAGDRLVAGNTVAYFSADGESIPYGKPYCLVAYE